MEEKNSVWGYILVAVVTIVIGVGIGLCISYFTKEDKEPNVSVDNDSNWEENNGQTNTEDKEENEIKDWTDYVLNQEITEMYIATWGEDENQQPYSRNINITKEELSNIFTEMKKGKLTKNYISGSGDTTPDLVIKYTSNNKDYELRIKQGRELWATDLDEKIVKYLSNNATEVGNANNNDYVVYVYDWNGTEYLNKLVENK